MSEQIKLAPCPAIAASEQAFHEERMVRRAEIHRACANCPHRRAESCMEGMKACKCLPVRARKEPKSVTANQ